MERRTGRVSEATVSVRVPRDVLTSMRAYARRSGKPVSQAIRDLLEIAMRTDRYPGIIFIHGPAGRRAHLAGTGLDVWEVVEMLKEYGSPRRLRAHFPRLSEQAIRIVLAYAQAYPEEINAFLEQNARPERAVRGELPWAEEVRT